MQEWHVGSISDFDDEQRRIVTVGNSEIVVFRHGERFYALDNVCLHMGGPVGEGVILGKVEAILTEDKRFVGERFSEEEIHIVCPWHGYEYDIETGRFAGDRKRRLRTYQVSEREGNVYVSA